MSNYTNLILFSNNNNFDIENRVNKPEQKQ